MISGKLFRDAIINGAVCLENDRQKVDELNVYPVPDGDTGTNMSMTINAARKELELLSDDVSVSKVADTAASAMLRGARGNSGVILSILFRGFSKAFKDLESAGCVHFSNALEHGVDAAYKAVMKPTEGTILTVARLASQTAQKSSRATNEVPVFWKTVYDAASEALAKTPEMLPILKKSGVVDAGGQGLVIIFRAMLDVFEGRSVSSVKETVSSGDTAAESDGADEADIRFTYCTECIITKSAGCRDAASLRAYLETIGDCVLVVDDEEIIKVHVHTNEPGNVLQKALEYGYINLPKIENMKLQHDGKVKEKAQKNKVRRTRPEKKYGFVAVAAGHGVEALFRDLGADCIVTGGQTMNPSTEDIINAVYSTPAETVFILPNNKNIIMAAEQAVRFADRGVCVLQTRTIPQGIAAMLAFDESADVSDNRTAMTKAFEKVSTGLVTFAARNTEFDGKQIKKGEIIALDNNKLAFTDKDVTRVMVRLVKKLVNSETSYVTLIYGADVTDESAEKMHRLISQKLGDKVEVMLVNGGQPVYYYIISVE
ncbi:DAK2 domain-containing protein [Ruminococcus sp. HUN007]|uniref:DAK2 domain-containing protein n=1 Tax=Ruminococcus sp. HUN007 TaxID=1514668 RepID=UPI0005D24D11|nr:DAK2 domain-containing protein [Ruminococcus sp. HUN007]